MAKNKTAATTQSVKDFISKIDNETKRDDSFQLIEICKEITGAEPYMYGPSIVGFGNYHYKYESGHEGDAPLTAFAPRKEALVIYLSANFDKREELLQKLGKHKTTKGCVYIKKLDDVDVNVLKKMILLSFKHVKKMYPSK